MKIAKKFKNKIIYIIIKNKLVTYTYYNNNISRFSFWNNNFKNVSKKLFEYYVSAKKEYYNLKFVDFLKIYFLDKKPKNYKKYKDIYDFATNYKGLINSQTFYSKIYFQNSKKYLNFQAESFPELIYCIRNHIKERPKCKNCGQNDCRFHFITDGFKQFCSRRCQISSHNTEFIPQESKLSDDEIREIIKQIKPDVRNLMNKKIADVFINIYNYSKEERNLTNKERIYLFLNKIPLSEIYCPYCGEKKLFNSQVVGYKKTCGRVNCISECKHPNSKNYSDRPNFRVSVNYSSIEKPRFLYVLKSPSKNIFKIGIATNPEKRFRTLKKNIDDLEVVYCVYIQKANILEQKLHKIFEDKKVYFDIAFDGFTEYFSLTKSDLHYIKDLLYEAQQ